MIHTKKTKVVTERSYADRSDNFVTKSIEVIEKSIFGIVIKRQSITEELVSIEASKKEQEAVDKSKKGSIGFGK